MSKFGAVLGGAAAILFAATQAQAAPLVVSQDPFLAYAILAAAGALVVLLGIGAYRIERRH
jgi:hypothetical protein